MKTKNSFPFESRDENVLSRKSKGEIPPQPHLLCFVCLNPLHLHAYRLHLSSKHRIYDLPDSLILPQYIQQKVFFEIFNKKAQRIHERLFKEDENMQALNRCSSSEANIQTSNSRSSSFREPYIKTVNTIKSITKWDGLLKKYLKDKVTKSRESMQLSSYIEQESIQNLLQFHEETKSVQLDKIQGKDGIKEPRLHISRKRLLNKEFQGKSNGRFRDSFQCKNDGSIITNLEKQIPSKIRNQYLNSPQKPRSSNQIRFQRSSSTHHVSSKNILSRYTLHKPTENIIKREIFVSSPGTIPPCIQSRFAFHNIFKIGAIGTKMCLFGGCRILRAQEFQNIVSFPHNERKSSNRFIKREDTQMIHLDEEYDNCVLTNSLLEFIPTRMKVKNSATISDKKWDWLTNGGRWEEIIFKNSDVPSPRMYHTVVEFDGKLYVYGGESRIYESYNPVITSPNQLLRKDEELMICSDFYVFDIESRKWSKLLEPVDELALQNIPPEEQEQRAIEVLGIRKIRTKYEEIVKELDSFSNVPSFNVNTNVEKKVWKDKDLTLCDNDEILPLSLRSREMQVEVNSYKKRVENELESSDQPPSCSPPSTTISNYLTNSSYKINESEVESFTEKLSILSFENQDVTSINESKAFAPIHDSFEDTISLSSDPSFIDPSPHDKKANSSNFDYFSAPKSIIGTDAHFDENFQEKQNDIDCTSNYSSVELTLEEERARIRIYQNPTSTCSVNMCDGLNHTSSHNSLLAQKDFINTQNLTDLRKTVLQNRSINPSSTKESEDPLSQATCSIRSSYLGTDQVIEDELSDIDSIIDDSEPKSQPLSHLSDALNTEFSEDATNSLNYISGEYSSKIHVANTSTPSSPTSAIDAKVTKLNANNLNSNQTNLTSSPFSPSTRFTSSSCTSSTQSDATTKSGNVALSLETISALRPFALSRHASFVRCPTVNNDNLPISSLCAYLVLYGGKTFNGEATSDLWLYNFYKEIWQRRMGPPPRHSHSACFDSQRDRMIVFGGVSVSNTLLNDLWIHRFHNDSLQPIHCIGTTRPSPRYGHTASYQNNRLFILGGMDSKKSLQDCWMLNLNTCTWTEIFLSDSIPGRGFHGLLSLDQNHAVLYGGVNQKKSTMHTAYILEFPEDVDEANIHPHEDILSKYIRSS